MTPLRFPLLLASACAVLPASATTFSWDGQLSGDWGDFTGSPPNAQTNWSPDLTIAAPIPDSNDTVVFASSSPHNTVDLGGNRTVQKV